MLIATAYSAQGQLFSGRTDYSISTDPTGVFSADFNNDTHVDLVVTDWSQAQIFMLTNNGSGGFTGPSGPFGVGPGAVSLYGADLNNDN